MPKKPTSSWDNIFLEQKVFPRLSHFAISLVIWFRASWALKSYRPFEGNGLPLQLYLFTTTSNK